jgi:hypothetical protein
MSKSKAKGTRAENHIVKLHADLGVEAERMPLSGSLGGKYADDVVLPYGRGEVKARRDAAGWQTLKKWMKGCASMFLKEDRVPPLVVLRWDIYADLVQRAYGVAVSEPVSDEV